MGSLLDSGAAHSARAPLVARSPERSRSSPESQIVLGEAVAKRGARNSQAFGPATVPGCRCLLAQRHAKHAFLHLGQRPPAGSVDRAVECRRRPRTRRRPPGAEQRANGRAASMTSPWPNAVARSSTCSSSRTLPGQRPAQEHILRRRRQQQTASRSGVLTLGQPPPREHQHVAGPLGRKGGKCSVNVLRRWCAASSNRPAATRAGRSRRVVAIRRARDDSASSSQSPVQAGHRPSRSTRQGLRSPACHAGRAPRSTGARRPRPAIRARRNRPRARGPRP